MERNWVLMTPLVLLEPAMPDVPSFRLSSVCFSWFTLVLLSFSTIN